MTKPLIAILMFAACATTKPTKTTPTGNAPQLAARRAQMIEYLHAYADAAIFPLEDGVPVSVFRDAFGTRCPMAELIYRSGHPELVDAVVRENNHLRLADVHDGPLHDWMLDSGLTREEIVMIQGELEIDFGKEPPSEAVIYLTLGRVRGRLEVDERMLRDNTKGALEKATAALRDRKRPVVAVRPQPGT